MSSQTISAEGSTTPIPISYATPGSFNPGILANVSSGATLTFTVEATGDDITAPGYDPDSGIWNALDDMADLTDSANATLIGLVTAVRCTVTAYTSGTVTFQVVQAAQ